MLRIIAQYKRSQNVILLGIIAVLAIGMIIAYGTPSSWNKGTGPKVVEPPSDTEIVAEVDGAVVTAKEYSDGIQRFLQMYQNFLKQSPQAQLPQTVRDLRERGTDKELLRSLIREKLVAMEAERLGLTATDEELRNRIREQNSVDGKWIGYEKFRRNLDRQGIDIIEYEKDIRKQITEDKLRSFVTAGVQISPKEIEKDYRDSNTKLTLSFVAVSDTEFKDKVTAPTDAEIRAYFDAHKDEFKATKDQRKIRYIYVSQEKAGETVPVSDEELRKEFDPEKYVKSVKVSQIVLKVLTPKDADTVRAKANELVQRARGKDGKPGEDFAALARGNSQDTATAPKGGDLGVVNRDDVKQGNPVDAAFSLKVNDISEAVKKDDAYYIFKVTERTLKNFDEAKPALMASVRNRVSYKRASEIADKAVTLFVKNKDIQKTAAEIAKEMTTATATVNPQDLIRETPYFVPGDELPEIGSNPSFEEKTSVLTAPGDVGEKIGIRGGIAVPQLADIRKPGGDPVFEDVKDKAAEKAKSEKTAQMAFEVARRIIAEAKTPDGLKAVVEKINASDKLTLKVEETKEFNGASAMGGKQYPAGFYKASQVKIGELVPEPVSTVIDKFTTVAVMGVTARAEADLTKLPTETKSIETRLKSARENQVFEAYLDGLRNRLRDAGRLKVNNDVAERVLLTLSQGEEPALPVQEQ